MLNLNHYVDHPLAQLARALDMLDDAQRRTYSARTGWIQYPTWRELEALDASLESQAARIAIARDKLEILREGMGYTGKDAAQMLDGVGGN